MAVTRLAAASASARSSLPFSTRRSSHLTVRRHRSLQMLRVDVHEGDVDPVQRRLLGDLRAHGAGADNEQTPLGHPLS